MRTIVFSRDRALQLHAFLRSYAQHVTPLDPVDVLYLSTSDRHWRAYESVFHQFPWVVPHSQSPSFQQDVVDLVSGTGTVIFFVDDQVFLRPWTVEELPGLSLRLGLHLTYNYASDEQQALPLMHPCLPDKVTWQWSDGGIAWRYPLSLDGHVYDALEFSSMLRPLLLRPLHFYSPNTLEAALQRYASDFRQRYGFCYYKTRVVNIPWNCVQQDWHNRCAIGGATSVEDMLAHWEAGLQIDLSGIDGTENISVHQEFPLELEVRR